MKRLSIALAVAGLTIGAILVGWFGFDNVLDAVLSVGWGGFILLVGCQAGLFLILGLAWEIIVPNSAARRWWVFFWGRMVRDSVGNCLPLSQMGGFVAGARAVTLHGIGWPLAAASTVVDVTAEVLAELAFIGLGLCVLVAREPNSPIAAPLAAALGATALAIGIFIWLQQGASTIFAKLGRRVAGQRFADAELRVQLLQGEFNSLYRRAGYLALGAGTHLLGWLASGLWGWIAFRLLGADITVLEGLAIEALLSAVLAMAFLVPAYAGVQEAAYAGLGAVFGVPPELSIGVSILRRAKDLALGVPIVLLWQFAEARKLAAQPPG